MGAYCITSRYIEHAGTIQLGRRYETFPQTHLEITDGLKAALWRDRRFQGRGLIITMRRRTGYLAKEPTGRVYNMMTGTLQPGQ